MSMGGPASIDSPYVEVALPVPLRKLFTYDVPIGGGDIGHPTSITVSEPLSSLDVLVLGLDESGETLWSRRYGDGGFDRGVGLRAASLCGALVALWNASTGGVGVASITEACP